MKDLQIEFKKILNKKEERFAEFKGKGYRNETIIDIKLQIPLESTESGDLDDMITESYQKAMKDFKTLTGRLMTDID